MVAQPQRETRAEIAGPQTHKLTWRKKLLFAAITVVLFFLTLETLLAVFGIDQSCSPGSSKRSR